MSKAVQTDDKTKKTPHSVELKFGYEDKDTPETKHRRVVFGKRPNAAEFMNAAENSSGSDTQFSLELAQTAVVEFGEMSMPVPLTVLLSLNQIDREKLLQAYYSFLADSGTEGGANLGGGKVKLGVGIERGNKKIVDVEFGKLLTGYDEIDIERESTGVWNANALRMTKEITSPKDLTVQEIESLDIDDFTLLRNAEEEWLNSFRG